MNSKEFSEALKERRKKLGMTQAEVAEKLGVPIKTYTRWEHNQNTALELTMEGALARLAKIEPKKKSKQ